MRLILDHFGLYGSALTANGVVARRITSRRFARVDCRQAAIPISGFTILPQQEEFISIPGWKRPAESHQCSPEEGQRGLNIIANCIIEIVVGRRK
jgi:hypothetical protein